MGKRAVIYTAGMLFVSPMVYTKDVGSNGTLPTFKAGDPDCVLPEGLEGGSQAPAASPLLQVKSHRAPSAALSAVATDRAALNAASADPRAQASRRKQYGSQPTTATRLGPLGPTGPGSARTATQYASAPPAWSSARPTLPTAGVARQASPQWPMMQPAAGMGGGYPQPSAMPSFGTWPSAASESVPSHRSRRQSGRSGSGSGMGMGSRPSSSPRFSAAPRQFAAARPMVAPQSGSGFAGVPVESAYPAAGATAPVPAAAGWMPYGRPAYPMPMMPTPVPYGAIPIAAAAAAPASAASSAAASPREAQLAAQVQQMEQRLQELEARLQRDGSSRP